MTKKFHLLKQLSIQHKLLFIQFISSAGGLILASSLLLFFQVAEFKKNIKEDLTAIAELIGNRSSAALLFHDPELAKENLSSLEQIPSFYSSCIYDTEGQIFTSYQLSVYYESPCPELYLGEETHFKQTLLYIYQSIKVDDDELGTVFIFADLELEFFRKLQSIGLFFIVLVIATLVTFLLTTPFLKVITTPINRLLKTVNQIAKDKDYSKRASKINNDELGKLVDSFNGMINMVNQQNLMLTATKNHYLALYEDNPAMIFNLTTEGKIISINRSGANQIGIHSTELENTNFFDFVHPGDQMTANVLFDSCIASPDKTHRHEIRMICRDERILWVNETARMILNEKQQKNIMLVCMDITENRILSEKVAYQASHDSLTGLVNRNEFDHVLQIAEITSKENCFEHALCYLDLDQFKIINDTCGHLAGDELLRQLSQKLSTRIRKEDVLARLGGDEFGIIMYHCSLESAQNASEKLKAMIKDFQFVWEGRSFFVGVSIGISSINEYSGNSVEIMKEADAACYAAKEKGRNRVHIFRPDDEELKSRQGEMRWVEKIKNGIKENKFVLYGQLIVPTTDNDEGMHFETLVRYQEGDKTIPPGAFLPAAERYDVAPTLDKWVIEQLFHWLQSNPDKLAKLSLCSVNLSGLSMSDETMLDFITEAFRYYEIETSKICFEITETAAITNLGYATKFIESLRAKGCSFSLDDFGSGLSSFAYLKNLPVDYLKIDGVFVKDILDDEVDLAMVKSINEVGHVMNKKTIAEFVENQSIYLLLKELGVDYAQGYGIAKPQPLEKLSW